MKRNTESVATRLNQPNINCQEDLVDALILNSLQLGKKEFYLGTHCLPKGRMPEICLEHHMLAINTGSSMNCELKVDGCTHHCQLSTNEIQIVPAGHVFEACWEREMNAKILMIPETLLSRNALSLWGSHQFEIISRLQVKDSFINQIALVMSQELATKVPNQIYIDTMLNTLAIHLLQRFSKKPNTKAQCKGVLSPQRLTIVLNHINSNLESVLTIEDLAVLVHLSQYHFSRSFKQATGLSPHQYIIQQRVERAKQMLSINKATINEVVISCGFSSQSHLNRHFKRSTGITPKAFQTL